MQLRLDNRNIKHAYEECFVARKNTISNASLCQQSKAYTDH